MALRMFEENNDGIKLPNPPLSLRVHLVIESAICAAWRLMTDHGRSGFDLQNANEDTITHELYQRLYDEVFDKGVVNGFDREVFASMRREPKVRNFNGSHPDKMPDMLVEFIDRPVGAMNSQHGLFIECKPVDRKHPAGSAYCDEGVIRFIRGDYAWTMQSAMMIGYARNGYSLLSKLTEAFVAREGFTASGPGNCPRSQTSAHAEPVAITKHHRTFNYVENGKPAGIIALRHLWLKRV